MSQGFIKFKLTLALAKTKSSTSKTSWNVVNVSLSLLWLTSGHE